MSSYTSPRHIIEHMFDTTEPAEAIAPSRSTVAGLPGELFSDSELVEELASHAAHLAVAECRYVLLVAEIDRREIWGDPGTRSCAHWLNWRCGTSMSAAREQVRVGRALERLPLVRGAFASGQISYSKARAITRIATPQTEAQLVEWAGVATAAQMEQIVRSYRRASSDEGTEALAKHHRRYLRTYTDSDGMVVIQALLAPEDGAIVLGAIEAARDQLREDRAEPEEQSEPVAPAPPPAGPDVSAETPSSLLHHVNEGEGATSMERVDALVHACRSVLEGGLSSADHEPQVQVVVHVDEKVLENPSAEGCSYIEGVGAISSHTARRLVCDAGIAPLIYKVDAQVESEGMTRSIPRQMRRAVLARDGGCRWPACTQRRYVELHHVVFWSRGGRTSPGNLVTICRFHHRLVHEAGYRLEMSGSGQMRVFTPLGAEVPVVAPVKKASGPDLIEQHHRAGLTINGETMFLGWNDPCDMSAAAEWLGWANKQEPEVFLS